MFALLSIEQSRGTDFLFPVPHIYISFFLLLSRPSFLTSEPRPCGGLWLLHGLVPALPSEAAPAHRPPPAFDHFPSWDIKGLLVLQGHES